MRSLLRSVRLVALLLPLAAWIVAKEPDSKDSSPGRGAGSLKGLEKPDHAAQARVTESYGKLPLSFEANRGQTDSEVKFFSRGSGYGIFITPTEAVLSLSSGLPQKTKGPEAGENLAAPSLHEEAEAPQRRAVLRMKLVGANPKPQLTGEEEL